MPKGLFGQVPRLAVATGVSLLVAAMPNFADAAPAAQQACTEANIRAPQQGAAVSGSVAIFGSARIDEFNFYKVEYAPGYNPENWAAVSQTVSNPVINGLLDVWNTTTVPDGSYLLKLTVVNPRGEEVCRFTVADLYVGNSATPTPSATSTPRESPTPTPTFGFEATEAPTPRPTVAPIVPSGTSEEPFSSQGIQALVAVFLLAFASTFAVALIALFLHHLRGT